MTICIDNTPVEDHLAAYGLLVKREDLCCPPGPHFSKTRGVFPHAAQRPETLIGVLDTSHSQGGWAVAQACAALGKRCRVYYPVYKGHEFDPLKPQQRAAQALGAELFCLPAGRSAVLYHQAKRSVTADGGYMFPNALKLPETVDATALELWRTVPGFSKETLAWPLIISASSGTIASGLVAAWPGPIIVHMGYSRPEGAVRSYLEKMTGASISHVTIIDEGYEYKDEAPRDAPVPPWPCNRHYDLKAFAWWVKTGREHYKRALFWNVG